MSELPPSDWKEYTFTDLAKYYNGLAFRPEDLCSREGTPVIRIEQLNNPEGDYDYAKGPFPSTNVINNEDLIFSWSATLKAMIWKHGPAVLNQHLFKVVPHSGIDKKFLLHLLDQNLKSLASSSQGTTMQHIKRSTLKKCSVFIPNNQKEQKKIAEILTTVDRQIGKTEALIAKYEEVKQGIMSDLFARGLNEDASLRPPLNENPEQYIHTQLGTLPSDWEVTPIYSVAEVVRGGSPRPKGDPRYYGGEVPRLMVEDVTRDGMWVTPKTDSLTQLGATLSRYMPAGTLTLVCSGTVGIPSILATDACIHDGFLALDSVSSDIDVKYLYWWFVYAKDQMDAAATHGGIFTNLTTKIVKEIPVPIPDLAEQNKIANILSIQENLIQSEYILIKKLQALKRGLMQDLLTGKVRVNLDQVEEAVANA